MEKNEILQQESEPNLKTAVGSEPLYSDASPTRNDNREHQRAGLRAKIDAGRRAMKNKKTQMSNESSDIHEDVKIAIDIQQRNVDISAESAVSQDFLEHLSKIEEQDRLGDIGVAVLPPPPPITHHVDDATENLQIPAENGDSGGKVAFVVTDASSDEKSRAMMAATTDAVPVDENKTSSEDVQTTANGDASMDYERMIIQLKHIMSDDMLHSEASSSSDSDSSWSTSGEDNAVKGEEELIHINAQGIAAAIEHQNLMKNPSVFSTMLCEYLDSFELQSGLEHLVMSHGLDAPWHELENNKSIEAYLMNLYENDCDVQMHQKIICRLASLFQRVRKKIEG